jgi:hypothetical protein
MKFNQDVVKKSISSDEMRPEGQGMQFNNHKIQYMVHYRDNLMEDPNGPDTVEVVVDNCFRDNKCNAEKVTESDVTIMNGEIFRKKFQETETIVIDEDTGLTVEIKRISPSTTDQRVKIVQP